MGTDRDVLVLSLDHVPPTCSSAADLWGGEAGAGSSRNNGTLAPPLEPSAGTAPLHSWPHALSRGQLSRGKALEQM